MKEHVTLDNELYEDDLKSHPVQVDVPIAWYNKLGNEYINLPNENWDTIIYELGFNVLLAIRNCKSDKTRVDELINSLRKGNNGE